MQLTDRPTSELQHLGNRCLHFTWKSRGTVSLEGLELQVSRFCFILPLVCMVCIITV